MEGPKDKTNIELLIAQGDLKTAEEVLNKNSAMIREDKCYYQGLISFKKDQYDQAIESTNAAIDLNPHDFRYHELLGQALGLKAQQAGLLKATLLLPKAKKSFEKALELNPKALTAQEGLFLFYLFVPGIAGGDEQKAAGLIKTIRSIDEAHGYLMQAMYDAKKSRLEQAEEAFKKAADLGTEDADVQWRAARFFLDQNRLDLAEHCFNQYLRLRPDDPAGLVAVGELSLKNKDYLKALNTLNQALRKHENYATAYLKRAEVLEKLGRPQEAILDYQWIVNHYPDWPLAHKAKEELKRLK